MSHSVAIPERAEEHVFTSVMSTLLALDPPTHKHGHKLNCIHEILFSVMTCVGTDVTVLSQQGHVLCMVLGLVSIYLDISEVESVSHIAQISSNLLYSFNIMTNGYSKKILTKKNR